jgi:hypothetical protein
VLWRRPGQRAVATTASLRLALAPQGRQLAVRVLKRRGGDLARPVFVDVETAGTESDTQYLPAWQKPPSEETGVSDPVSARHAP